MPGGERRSPGGAEGSGREARRPPLALLGFTLTFAMALGNLVQFAIGALGPILTSDLSLTRAQLGTLTSVYFTAGVLLSPRMGGLVDRFGGRAMLAALFGSVAAALLAMAAAPTYVWLLAATAIAAGPLAISNPATNQLVAVAIPRGQQGVVLGVKQSGVQVSAFLAGFVLPGAALALGWRTVLALAAALGVLGVLAVLRTVPVPPPTRRRVGDAAPSPLPRLVWWLAAYAALMGAGLAALITYLPLYAHEVVGLSVTAAGATAGLMGLVGIPARILWAREAERRDAMKGPLLWMGVVAAIASVGLLLAATAPLFVWVAVIALGASSGAWLSVAMLAVVRGTAGQRSGRASGIVLGGFYVGMLASPPIVGWSVDVTGAYVTAWWVLIAVSGASALLVALWRAPVGGEN